MSTEAPTSTAPQSPSTQDTLLAALEETRAELARARDDLQSTVRSISLDRALAEAGAASIAAARARIDDAAALDPVAAVAALRASEPALFAPRPRINPGLSTSAPRTQDDSRLTLVRTAATRAATGDRRALLDYMRLRRSAT